MQPYHTSPRLVGLSVFSILFQVTPSFQIGDLVGTSLLALAFIILEVVGDKSLEDLPAHGHAQNITDVVNATLSHLTTDLH